MKTYCQGKTFHRSFHVCFIGFKYIVFAGNLNQIIKIEPEIQDIPHDVLKTSCMNFWKEVYGHLFN